MGMTYFIAFFFVTYAIRKVGASSTTVVSVLSILLPISLAVVLYHEYPSRGQAIGIGLALVSLLLIAAGRKPRDIKGHVADTAAIENGPSKTWVVPLILAVFFFLCGMNRVYQDAFKHLSSGEHRPAFLVAAFTMASLPSLVVLFRRKTVPLPAEFGVGVAMGLANVLQTFFVLRALQHLEGYIVFTLASCGAIVLTTIVATWLMGERISRQAQLGISLAVIALVFLRWLPG
jgi:drug/metabolite transporter (DMT)-like permease